MMLAGDGERVMAFGNVELVPEKVRAVWGLGYGRGRVDLAGITYSIPGEL